MSNAQDLLSILGGASARAPNRASTTSGSSETSILNFKAGKMITSLKPNGKYLVEPDMRRGELHIVWTNTATTAGGAGGGGGGTTAGHLKLEWKDRRTKTVVNTIPIFPEDDATFERVETGREGDRVYLLQNNGEGRASSDSRHFFWMQDKDTDPDEDLCVKVNLYMSDYSEAATAAGAANPDAAASSGGDSAATTAGAGLSGSGMDNAELLRLMQGALGSQSGASAGLEGARTATVPGGASIPTANAGQVDAIGNILENLGTPHPNGTPAGERNADTAGEESAAASGGTAAGGGLTLADLQGAMAGLATASPSGGAGTAAASAGPPLAELTSTDTIAESGILDDPETVARLVALLPEGQRTEDKLRENIRSPQVAQTLQRLTSALVDEDGSSFNSIIANFQLDPADGGAALLEGNPIEAFLNCLLKDVEKKEGTKKKKQKTEDSGEGGGETKEGEGGGDGDAKMDES